MDGLDRGRRGRRSFKERMGFKVICCCGSNWGLRSTNMSFRDEDEVENEIEEPEQELVRNPAPVSFGMNLAAALAAERHLRGASHEPQGTPTSNAGLRSPGTPMRVSLMRLLEEGDAAAEEMEKGRSMEMGSDSMCCVCMGRKKGAAFIPCGHTFCRVCSRELWLNRGSCPLCNRPILEILDIF